MEGHQVLDPAEAAGAVADQAHGRIERLDPTVGDPVADALAGRRPLTGIVQCGNEPRGWRAAEGTLRVRLDPDAVGRRVVAVRAGARARRRHWLRGTFGIDEVSTSQRGAVASRTAPGRGQEARRAADLDPSPRRLVVELALDLGPAGVRRRGGRCGCASAPWFRASRGRSMIAVGIVGLVVISMYLPMFRIFEPVW